MTSPLLTLPRELRDDIYSHLHQDITFKDDYGSKKRLENSVLVTVKNAPLPAALMVSRQLREEYMQSINCSAHIASDGLGATKTFRDLEPRLQNILTRHIRTVTLVIDWRYRSEHSSKKLEKSPETLWCMLQRFVHDLIHPQVTTLKIQYLDFIHEHAFPAFRTVPIEDLVLTLRDQGGALFPPPPRTLDSLRLVQYADAYTTIRYAYIGISYGVRPARVAFLAYSIPGHKLNEQSLWSVNEQSYLRPLAIDGLGYMKNGRYCEGIQPSKELRDVVDRRRVDAITNSATYAFACELLDCRKCAAIEAQIEPTLPDCCVPGHWHEAPYAGCGPRLHDAPSAGYTGDHFQAIPVYAAEGVSTKYDRLQGASN